MTETSKSPKVRTWTTGSDSTDTQGRPAPVTSESQDEGTGGGGGGQKAGTRKYDKGEQAQEADVES